MLLRHVSRVNHVFVNIVLQVVSAVSGRVLGAKEVRVLSDKVNIVKLSASVVSGLQLAISPDTGVDNGYIAQASVTRKLTAQYQVRFGV